MKFQIEPNQFKSVMQRMCAVIQNRSTIPVLQNVRISVTGDTATFTATDLDIQITESVSVTGSQSGETTVAANTLKDIVSKVDTGLISVSVSDNTMHIQAGKSKFKLATLPASDFPEIASQEYDARITFKGYDLKNAIERTIWAAGTEETRYYLNGIAMQTLGEDAVFVATDGHRLAKYTMECSEPFPNVIIPSKACKQLASVLTDMDVELAVSETKVRLVCGSVVVVSKAIDGTYPQWERVIPAASKNSVTASSVDLARAVERVQVVMTERTKIMKLMVRDGELTLHSPARDGAGEATDTVEAERDGVDVDIGISTKYALDAMKQAEKGSVRIEYNDAMSPLVVKYDKEPELLVVVMPARF